jgi:replicative DNA helicase
VNVEAAGGGGAPLRLPPHNIEAEQGVLASILLNNQLLDSVLEILRPDDFYTGGHRTLYSLMMELSERGRAIDQLTLGNAIAERAAEKETGGAAYLSDLIQAVPTTANAMEYARIVKDKSTLRRTISAAQEIASGAFQGPPNLDEFLDRSEQAIFQVGEERQRTRQTFFSMGQLVRESMREIEKLFERKEHITGVPSGFDEVDKYTAGFQKQNLVIVAARPGMGKTALCLNIAQNAALKHGIPVAVFSLEMSKEELVMRMICSEARVNSQKMRRGYVGQQEMNHIVRAVARLSEAPIVIDDTGALSCLELRARARRLKKERRIGLLVVDYLQLMRGSGSGGPDNRVQEISEISRSLKALAKELDIPVIALSQLNRGVESRQDKRPLISDLRESGAIEQDADMILFIYRESMYNREMAEDQKGTAEVIVGKNRNGPQGTANLVWFGEYTRFESLEAHQYE